MKRSDLPPGAWDAFCLDHPAAWFWTTEAWMAYALAYAPGSEDRSVAAVDDSGAVRGIRPQIVLNGRLSHGGQDTPVSLIDLSIDVQTAGEAVSCLFHAFPRSAGRLQGPVGLDSSGGETYVVDFADGDEAAHWSRIRRSYRALIHAAERTYGPSVLSQCDPAIAELAIEQARNLHAQAAGRETRSLETWRLMGEWLTTGVGVIALAYDQKEPVGFAYILRYKNFGYWASGATVRPNLQCALQWHAMKFLRCDGQTRYYELGHAAKPCASGKEQGIGFLKSGFGGVKMGRSVIEVGV